MPYISNRSVARPEGGRAQARQERWRKIAVEALKHQDDLAVYSVQELHAKLH